MLLQNEGLRKWWLDKCLESPVTEDPLRGDIVEGQHL